MASPVRIYDNSTDITNSVDWKSVDMVSVLTKEVGSLKFNIRQGVGQTYPAKTIPQIGDTIELYDSTGIIFGGTVTQLEPIVSGLLITWQVTCTDWGYLLDGTFVKKNYSMMDPHDIAVDIINTFCGGKGFTTNHVQTGNFLIPSIKFNYQQPSKALQSLANLVGWDWFIDPDKDLHFFLGDVDDGTGGGAVGAGGAAPIIVDGTSGEIEWNSLDIDLQITNMQNSVYVIGGTYPKTFTAANTPDTFLTDGIRQFFSVSYPYYSPTAVDYEAVPITVTLDGTPQTVGIANQDDPSAFEVMYNDQQRWIQFTSSAPTTGQTVKVFGTAKVPIVAHASDAASVAAYGERQGVVSDTKILSVPEAQARATAQILQFGHPVYDLKFNTLIPGCAVGQSIFINLPAFGIIKFLIIKRIEAVGYAPGDDTLGIDGKLEYQIECIGSDNVTFTDLMTTILQQEASQTTVDDSTVTENLEVAGESLTIAETVAATSGTKPYRYGPSSPQARYGFAVYS
ncbi:MAG TPA: hypothetical protein VGL53_21550 [Bryobacteraceae bacterium]